MVERVGILILTGASLLQSGCASDESLRENLPTPVPVSAEPELTREVPMIEFPPEPALVVRVCLETDTSLQGFPWPPPEPSAMVKLPRALLLKRHEEAEPSLGTVAARLENVLGEAHYREYSFHAIGCDGFTLITGLERTDENGRPFEGSDRWAPPGKSVGWSLREYVARLFFSKPGYYRQIVFAATDEPYDPQELAEAPTQGHLRNWVKSGRGSLPEGDNVPFGPDHELYALIYEFRKRDTDGDVDQISPSLIGSNGHLATFYTVFEKLE